MSEGQPARGELLHDFTAFFTYLSNINNLLERELKKDKHDYTSPKQGQEKGSNLRCYIKLFGRTIRPIR